MLAKLLNVLYVLLLSSTQLQMCLVYCGGGGGGGGGGGAPGDTVTVSRYPAASADHSALDGVAMMHKTQQQYVGHSALGVQPAASVKYTHGSSSGHIEAKNSYNLLSEAMSQAVSNELSGITSTSSSSGSSASSISEGTCHADDLECSNAQDRLSMDAIRILHRQLDDDANGNIDLSESDDFLREELKYDSGYEKRQKAFHYNDDTHISVKELWEAWLRSEVHNWTVEQTSDWLAQSVQLPQYVDLFKIHKVTGATLPRLAVNNMYYIGNVLGIKDPIHKQKIALKAMDVVLFGPPRETGTRWKDYILVTLLLSAIIGCWYAYQQNKNAKRHLRRMAQDMEGLQKAEQSLQEMQKELERARMEQENVTTEKMDLERRLKEVPSITTANSDLEVQQLKKEIEILRSELSRAEIELVDNCWAPPPQLQSWLQYTYELESKNHLKKRVVAEKQLQLAREACEKLRKKRSSLVGAFVSTHGKSIDDVDRSIVEARNSLGDVTNELQERSHRWKQIEQCLGMNIVNNNGLQYLENVLYGRNGGTSLKTSRGRITSSSDDLDDESSVQGLIDGSYNRNSAASTSSLVNCSSNTVRDDSSNSEDGNHDGHPVQFYLGNNPPTSITNMPTTASTSAIHYTQQRCLPTPTSTASCSELPTNLSNPTTNTSGGATIHYFQDYSVTNHEANDRHTSVSSDSSLVAVPPRLKKSNHTNTSSTGPTPSPPPPPSSTPPTTPPSLQQPTNGPIGRTPLPPPRKTAPRPLLRSQSSELMTKDLLYNNVTRKPQSSFYTIMQIGRSINALAPAIRRKRMAKQNSTTSQQSTSSTSSSIQSAPDLGKLQQTANDGLSTTSLQNQHLNQQQQQQQQQQHLTTAAASTRLNWKNAGKSSLLLFDDESQNKDYRMKKRKKALHFSFRQ